MSKNTTVINRQHKDLLFRIIFREKKDLLQLYNALNESNYTNEKELIVNTLEDAIYLGIKNDLSFIIRDTLNLYEHQSTFNPNMGVRGFLYVADIIRAFIDRNRLDIHSSKRINLPFPQYMVFYNGTANQPERMTICLSDTFTPKPKGKKPAVECYATMLNINLGHNRELLEKCQKLKEYAIFIDGIRRRQEEGMPLNQATEETVNESIRNGVLEDILRKNRAEVTEVVLYEYDEELHIKNEKDISREEGMAIGHEMTLITQICRKLKKGKTPEVIAEELEEEFEIINSICKVAREFTPEYECEKIYDALHEK